MPLVRPLHWLYKTVISPAIHLVAGPGMGCRYQPTCSAYWLDSVHTRGIVRGSWMGLRRILTCHPWAGAIALLIFAGSANAGNTLNGPFEPSAGHSFFKEWSLEKYKGKTLTDVSRFDSTLQLAFDSPELSYVRDIRGKVEDLGGGRQRFTYSDDKLEIRRDFVSDATRPFVDIDVQVKFKKAPAKFAFVSIFSRLNDGEKDPDRKLEYFSANTLETTGLADPIALKEIATPTRWVAAVTRYFAFAVVSYPEAPRALLQEAGPLAGRLSLVYPISGNELNLKLRAYFGPKDLALLRAAEPSLDRTVDLGWFTIVAYPILRLLKWLYGFFQNYGIAIIVLTLVIKLITLPLTYKSMKSMRAMAKLQPEIQRLRERLKDNPEQLNREMLTFMRSRGYNPIAGCLPIIIQMPVFFALYRVLYSAVELYQAPFFGWIHDLSEKDPFYVTPVILTVTMFLQQKMSPSTATDPVQQKVMNFMPIMFGVLMVTLPSGLTLYMLVNALASILQQLWMNKRLEPVHGPSGKSR